MVVVAVIVGAYFVTHLDDEIRREVERLLASHYEHLDVRVGDARLVEGRGIEVRKLEFRSPSAPPGTPPILEIEEVFLACPVQINQLLQGFPPLDRVVLHRPHLRAVRQRDGSWDVSDLFPLPTSGESDVEVVVKKGLVELACDPRSPNSRITFREVTSVIRPAKPATAASSNRRRTREYVFGVSAVSPLCKLIRLSGRFDSDGRARLAGNLAELSLTGADLQTLPERLAGAARQLQQLRGTLILKSVELCPASTGSPTPQFAANVAFEEVEIHHIALPDPITKLSCEVYVSSVGLEAPKLAGVCGSARFSGKLRRAGWTKGSPFSVSGRVENLHLEERHWSMLPEVVRDVWTKYRPQGVVDLDLHEITFDGTHVIPHVKVACRDASLSADTISYRLRHVRGEVEIRPLPDAPREFATLAVKLSGEAAGKRQVAIDAAYTVATHSSTSRPEVYPVGSVHVTGHRVLVEENLLAALPDGPRRFLAELRPQGEFDFAWQAARTDPHVAEPHKQLELNLQGGSVNYVRFPYPLQDVRGKVYAANGNWDFAGLTASAGGGKVTVNGSLRHSQTGPVPEGISRTTGHDGGHPILTLQIACQRLALDPTLYAALPEHAQRAWDAVTPAGQIDVTVNYRQALGSGAAQIEYWIVPYGQTVSIRPQFFPCRIDQLQGRVHFAGPEIRFYEMSGQHGQTQIVAGGTLQCSDRGAWSLELNDLSVDRLVFEKELVWALPPTLQRLVTRMNPRGQIAIDRSSVRLSRQSPTDPVEAAWRLNFDFHQAELDCGVPLKNVSGAISLAGHARGEQFWTDGELLLDLVQWNKFFFHDVRGPLYADASRVVFGQNATQRGTGMTPNTQLGSRPITAGAYGGRISGDGVVTFGPSSQFALSAAYQGGDLNRLVTETWASRDGVKGTIYGKVNVKGMSESPQTITGEGVVALSQAELYQLPQLIRLFKLIRRREPDKTAFTAAHAEFQIAGRRVYFNKLNLSGDALTLYGQGSVLFDEFQQPLNLTFDSDLASPNAPLPGLRSVMRQASNQIVRTHVQGTMTDPRFNIEPLPVLSEALQQLQQELEPQASRPGENRGARGWFGSLFR